MVGYNNLCLTGPSCRISWLTSWVSLKGKAFEIAQRIIEGQNYGFSKETIQLHDRLIHQIDLMKIWHYDNEAKRCRLKDLQFAMRSHNVMDLPYDFRKPLSHDQIDHLIHYNKHDVTETEKFLNFSMNNELT